MKKILLSLMLVLMQASFAHAATHEIVKGESFIIYTAFVNDAPSQGKFTSFEGNISFYPDDLEKNYVEVTVHLTPETIKADYEDVAKALPGEDWLNVEEFPKAVLVAKDFEVNTHNTYKGYGKLTLLGQTHPVQFTFMKLNQENGNVLAETVFTVDRSKYGIGKGEWASDSTVANIVTINAHMVMRPLGQ